MSKKKAKKHTKEDTDLVIYEGKDETIICSRAREPEMVKAWFTETPRSLADYERSTTNEDVLITSYTCIRTYGQIGDNEK